MRWTPENENILWRTIFETQSFNINLDKVAEAWPGDEKPTPKALSEQLRKYKKNVKGDVTFSMSTKRAADPDSPDPRPRKRRTTKKAAEQAAEKAKVEDAPESDQAQGEEA